MYDNLVELSGSGFTGVQRVLFHSPLRLGKLFLDHAPAFSVLVGIAPRSDLSSGSGSAA